jgi:hypothetical protein
MFDRIVTETPDGGAQHRASWFQWAPEDFFPECGVDGVERAADEQGCDLQR